MTDTALIGSSCALGVFWSSKRYFDYLIDETNLSLLRGKEFGQAVIICPSLREGGAAIRRNTAPFLAQVELSVGMGILAAVLRCTAQGVVRVFFVQPVILIKNGYTRCLN